MPERYDAWFDSREGSRVFREELACIRAVCPEFHGRWLEVGVGTGRFASALGVPIGVDPSRAMLEIAAARGIQTNIASAERLTFADSTFDGVLMATTLCFVRNVRRSLQEAGRVMRPWGTLVIGAIPAESPWGRLYARKAAEGHPIYSLASFRSVSEIVAMADEAGFVLQEVASTLFWKPGETPPPDARIEKRPSRFAGFAAMRFQRMRDLQS